MPTVRIEGDGHSVSIESSDSLDYTQRIAREVWAETKVKTAPRLTVGFGSQHMERGGSSNVKGDPMHQYGGPVES